MITVPELIAMCYRRDPCVEAMDHLRLCHSMEEAMTHPKASEWAFWVRMWIQELPEEDKRKAEELACREPRWAYYLRTKIAFLPENVRIAAELKAYEEEQWADRMHENGISLHPDTIAKLAERGIHV